VRGEGSRRRQERESESESSRKKDFGHQVGLAHFSKTREDVKWHWPVGAYIDVDYPLNKGYNRVVGV
jgi:hypothetical protein